MKLAAIYNVWDGVELLPGSIRCLYQHVDMVIIVYQTISNYGERYNPMEQVSLMGLLPKIQTLLYEPDLTKVAFTSELEKRNIGIEYAKLQQCTHFLHVDCDEYYADFGAAKDLYIKFGNKGSVCSIFTYFKRPDLRFESKDGYFVPFIHELKADTKCIWNNPDYPFYCDPTRRVNETDVVELPITMHHFSWVRQDIERKCRNSSAANNISRGTMLEDYYSENVADGFYVRDYDKKLIEVQDQFGLLPLF